MPEYDTRAKVVIASLGVITILVVAGLVFTSHTDSQVQLVSFIPSGKNGLIWFTSQTPSSYAAYVASLSVHIKKLKHVEASRPELNRTEDVFDVEQVQNSSQCTESVSFGYKFGKPCVLLQFNKILNWIPRDFGNNSVPPEIASVYKEKHVAITCDGGNPASKENIGGITYYPSDVVPFEYFPLSGKPGQVAPFVWVQFQSITPGVVVDVVCKVWAQNVNHAGKKPEGVLRFDLLVD